MKKNVMMRVASVMLVLVLMTSSVISGTFAKYVTEGSASDSARVAKWGVKFDNDSDLFEKEYAYDDQSNNHFASWVYSVESKGGDDVVAPGTTGDAYNLTTTGTPEVSYIVEFKVDDTTLETVYLKKDASGALLADTYYPVQFALSIGGNSVAIADGDAATLKDAIEGVAYFYEVDTETYYCRTSKTGSWIACGNTAPSVNLSWNWKFFVDNGTDALDTVLGNLAADSAWYDAQGFGAADYNLDVSVTVNATATQIN